MRLPKKERVQSLVFCFEGRVGEGLHIKPSVVLGRHANVAEEEFDKIRCLRKAAKLCDLVDRLLRGGKQLLGVTEPNSFDIGVQGASLRLQKAGVEVMGVITHFGCNGAVVDGTGIILLNIRLDGLYTLRLFASMTLIGEIDCLAKQIFYKSRAYVASAICSHFLCLFNFTEQRFQLVCTVESKDRFKGWDAKLGNDLLLCKGFFCNRGTHRSICVYAVKVEVQNVKIGGCVMQEYSVSNAGRDDKESRGLDWNRPILQFNGKCAAHYIKQTQKWLL